MSRPIAFRIAAFLSLAIALMSYRFLFLGLEAAFAGMEGHITDRQTIFLVHIIASPIALATGVLQFLPRLRARRPALHRWTGRIYALAILFGGLAGLAMALDAAGGARVTLLGPVLRTETAAPVACALVLHALGGL